MSFTHIVIHHTVTPPGSGRQVADLKHYHLVIDVDKDGRPGQWIQSLPDHVKSTFGTGGFNSKGYCIAVVGNYEKHKPTQELLDSLVQAIVIKMKRLGLVDPDRVVSHNYVGRRLVASPYVTECPGQWIIDKMGWVKYEVARRL